MPKKKQHSRRRQPSRAAREYAARNACSHGFRTVVDPQGREWRYCHRCNLYEILGFVGRRADEEGA